MTAFNQLKKLSGAIALIAVSVSCGDVVRQGRSPVYLVIDQLTGSSGGAAGAAERQRAAVRRGRRWSTSPAPCSATAPCPTIFSDSGAVELRALQKDVSATSAVDEQRGDDQPLPRHLPPSRRTQHAWRRCAVRVRRRRDRNDRRAAGWLCRSNSSGTSRRWNRRSSSSDLTQRSSQRLPKSRSTAAIRSATTSASAAPCRSTSEISETNSHVEGIARSFLTVRCACARLRRAARFIRPRARPTSRVRRASVIC